MGSAQGKLAMMTIHVSQWPVHLGWWYFYRGNHNSRIMACKDSHMWILQACECVTWEHEMDFEMVSSSWSTWLLEVPEREAEELYDRTGGRGEWNMRWNTQFLWTEGRMKVRSTVNWSTCSALLALKNSSNKSNAGAIWRLRVTLSQQGNGVLV